jgi:hypothetical protein
MKVELLPHVGNNVSTGKSQMFKQYKVVADGELVGYKSWRTGSKIVYIGLLSPMDRQVVESEVSAILSEESEGVSPPDVSEDDMAEQEEYHNDFDES